MGTSDLTLHRTGMDEKLDGQGWAKVVCVYVLPFSDLGKLANQKQEQKGGKASRCWSRDLARMPRACDQSLRRPMESLMLNEYEQLIVCLIFSTADDGFTSEYFFRKPHMFGPKIKPKVRV